MSLLTPLGAAIAELLADDTVKAITTRIRPVEPGENDARGSGQYVPFVVLSTLDAPIQATVATSSVSLGVRAYAATFSAAEALYLACIAVFHRRGPRIAGSGLGIYNSLAIGGPTLGKDPDTQQPVASGVVELNVSIQPV
jgi:hypothetical protein